MLSPRERLAFRAAACPRLFHGAPGGAGCHVTRFGDAANTRLGDAANTGFSDAWTCHLDLPCLLDLPPGHESGTSLDDTANLTKKDKRRSFRLELKTPQGGVRKRKNKKKKKDQILS